MDTEQRCHQQCEERYNSSGRQGCEDEVSCRNFVDGNIGRYIYLLLLLLLPQLLLLLLLVVVVVVMLLTLPMCCYSTDCVVLYVWEFTMDP